MSAPLFAMRRMQSPLPRASYRFFTGERMARTAAEVVSRLHHGPTPPEQARVAFVYEEDGDLRSIIVAALESREWRVTTPEGLAPTCEVFPSLVVVDARSSSSVGFQMLVMLRAREPELPVVVIASFGDSDVVERANAMGARAVIEKPFGVEELEAALAKI